MKGRTSAGAKAPAPARKQKQLKPEAIERLCKLMENRDEARTMLNQYVIDLVIYGTDGLPDWTRQDRKIAVVAVTQGLVVLHEMGRYSWNREAAPVMAPEDLDTLLATGLKILQLMNENEGISLLYYLQSMAELTALYRPRAERKPLAALNIFSAFHIAELTANVLHDLSHHAFTGNQEAA